jgi:CheY-like chemotaxis protein
VKKKILIVEDNKDSSEIIGLFITKIGHHPIKAKNSKEAITIAEAEEPDLIFMDLDLPDARWSQDNCDTQTECQNISHSCCCDNGVDLRTMARKG